MVFYIVVLRFYNDKVKKIILRVVNDKYNINAHNLESHPSYRVSLYAIVMQESKYANQANPMSSLTREL